MNSVIETMTQSANFYALFLLALVVSQSECDYTLGSCFRVVPTLVDEASLGGRWYEIVSKDIVTPAFVRRPKCSFVDIDVSNIGFGMRIRMNRTEFFKTSVRSTIYEGIQAASLSETPHGSFVLEMDGENTPDPEDANFHILHLDQESAVAFYCNYGKVMTSKFAWILSRERTLNQEKISMLERKLDFNQAAISNFRTVPQDDITCNITTLSQSVHEN
ncbi:uncharacterized protein LOC142348304 [Convolutriloba macropyga]|uniref:uncharacterized protein LOC142348304 n=1 Tax=Convolutriloba macropyga TaxID=536237 RepID=UPI003F521732